MSRNRIPRRYVRRYLRKRLRAMVLEAIGQIKRDARRERLRACSFPGGQGGI